MVSALVTEFIVYEYQESKWLNESALLLKSRKKGLKVTFYFPQSKKCNRTLSYLVVEKKFLVILGNKLSKGDSERNAERFSEAKEVETGLKRVTN